MDDVLKKIYFNNNKCFCHECANKTICNMQQDMDCLWMNIEECTNLDVAATVIVECRFYREKKELSTSKPRMKL